MPEVDAQERLGGLTLAQVAGVDTALAEGHALDRVLAEEGIDPAVFPAADQAWRRQIARDPEALEAFAECVAVAEDCLARPARPLDSDVRAWAGLLSMAERSGLPVAARSLGLTRGDLGRLLRAWHARLCADEGARSALRALSRAAPAPSALRLDPPVLRPFPWSPPAPGKQLPARPTFDAWQRLAFVIDGALPVERSVDVYAALVAALEAFPSERDRALELCCLGPADFARVEASWRERRKRDATINAQYAVRIGDHRALSATLAPRLDAR